MLAHEQVLLTSKQRRKMAEERATLMWATIVMTLIAGILLWLTTVLILHHKSADWLLAWFFGLAFGSMIAALAPPFMYFLWATWSLPTDFVSPD